jgi:hypothetical protein
VKEKAIQYQKIVDLMTWLLELNEEAEKKVSAYIKSVGIKTFFLNLESFDLSEDVLLKLQDLRAIIEAFDGEVGSLESDRNGGKCDE